MKKILITVLFTFFIISCSDGKTVDEDKESFDSDLADTDLSASDDDFDDDTDVADPDSLSCSSTQDCQENERSAGFLCLNSKCVPCEIDDQCKEDIIFGEYGACDAGRCSVSPGCLDKGCEGGQICDETTRLCRDKYSCDNDICKENQKCHDSGDGVDDYCLEECVSGYSWDATSLICKSVAANCQPGKENSLYGTCLAEFRNCVEDDNVFCGNCIDGYREQEGSCVKKIKCVDLTCALENRICVASDDEKDAYCDTCLAGYLESVAVNNSDFNDSDVEASGWTVETLSDTGFYANDEEEPVKLWDFSNCIILHTSDSGSCSGSNPASIEQTFDLAVSGTGKKLSVRFATKDESGALDKDALIEIKIEVTDGTSTEWKSLYSNTVSSYDGVQEKIFDLSGYSDITKVRIEGNCGGIVSWTDEHLVIDWVRIYSETSLEGECAEMIGTNCNSGDSDSSILKQCETEHRGCEMIDETTARCDGCKAGFIEVNETCELGVTCDMLICENSHKECVETPNAYCGDCLEGFLKNNIGECGCAGGTIYNSVSDSCEAIIDCDTLTCGEDETCIDPTATTDAMCSRCPEGQAYDKYNEECISCPLCVEQGETGRVYPLTSLEGHCVCETLDGYFHSSSAPVGTRKCDADGDGWITKEAEQSINAFEDSAEKINARCDLRYVDRVVLQNDLFERKSVRIVDLPDISLTKIPLYEPKNRDVQTYLIDDSSIEGTTTNYAPKYGETGVLFSVSELNPLTKACASTNEDSHQADYNANGIYDVDETGYKTSTASTVSQKVFTMFSYYLELHNSWYEKNKYSKYGILVIAEKSRSQFAEKGFSVPLNYGSERNDKYWRDCLRSRDSDYSEESGAKPYGLDFANYSDFGMCNPGAEDSWCGMNHHSQFKCMRILKDTESVDPEYPHHVKLADLDSRYKINLCNSTEYSYKSLSGLEKNPQDRQIVCESSDLPGESELVWIAVDYEDVVDYENYNYKNGCISECAMSAELPESMTCDGDVACRDNSGEGFGKIDCYQPMDMLDVYTNMTFSMGTATEDGVYDVGGADEFTWKGDNEDYHDVTLTYYYAVAKTETTVDQFIETMGYNPSKYDCQNAVCPVENVSFYDALAFANKRSVELGKNKCYTLSNVICADGRNNETDHCSGQGGIQSADVFLNGITKVQDCEGYRLPTEAEWEYVAGSGYEKPNYDDRPFFLGEITVFDCDIDPILNQIGWYCGNSETESQLRTHPVAVKRATDWGIYDMNGNVAEWVWDAYTQHLGSATDPAIVGSGDRVVRGGSFESNSQECRSSSRSFMPPSQRSGSVGFRIVRTLP